MGKVVVETAEVVGMSKRGAWTQAAVFETAGLKRIVIVTLEYEGESDLLDLGEIGVELIEALQTGDKLSENELKGRNLELKVGVLVADLSGQTMRVSGIGQVEVYIQREGKIGKIFQGQGQLSEVQGKIQAGDVLFLATKEAGEMLKVEGVKKVLEEGLSGNDELAVMIRGVADSSKLAAVIGEIREEDGVVEGPAAKPKILVKYVDRLGAVREFVGKIASRLKRGRPITLTQEKRKHNVLIGVVLLALLIIGVLGGIFKRSVVLEEKAFSKLEEKVEQSVLEALSVGDLNPERAKALLNSSQEEIGEYLAVQKDKEYQEKAQLLARKIIEAESQVFKKSEVNLMTLIELSILGERVSSGKMYLDEEGTLYLPDQNAATVYGVNLQDKSSSSVRMGDWGSPKEIAVSKGQVYGIVGEGVVRAGEDGAEVVIEPDDLWGEITLIDLFAGNIYLLDLGQSEIWKYPVLTEGWGSRNRWLGPGIELDLTKVVDMKVDGDLWIITSTGKLQKFSRGVPVTFTMEGFPYQNNENLQEPRAMHVTSDKVYVLEAGANRVVVLDKESGKYEKQYVNNELNKALDIVVWEDKVYLLLQDKVVWFEE